MVERSLSGSLSGGINYLRRSELLLQSKHSQVCSVNTTYSNINFNCFVFFPSLDLKILYPRIETNPAINSIVGDLIYDRLNRIELLGVVGRSQEMKKENKG
jgi:hypothetical protein